MKSPIRRIKSNYRTMTCRRYKTQGYYTSNPKHEDKTNITSNDDEKFSANKPSNH